MNNLQFTEMLANCHKPVLREESYQMFIYEEFLNKTEGKVLNNQIQGKELLAKHWGSSGEKKVLYNSSVIIIIIICFSLCMSGSV